MRLLLSATIAAGILYQCGALEIARTVYTNYQQAQKVLAKAGLLRK